MKALATIILAVALIGGATFIDSFFYESPDTISKVLKNDGITPVTIGQHAWFTCGDDTFATSFTGTKDGKTITGAVCSGWMKGHTIRFD